MPFRHSLKSPVSWPAPTAADFHSACSMPHIVAYAQLFFTGASSCYFGARASHSWSSADIHASIRARYECTNSDIVAAAIFALVGSPKAYIPACRYRFRSLAHMHGQAARAHRMPPPGRRWRPSPTMLSAPARWRPRCAAAFRSFQLTRLPTFTEILAALMLVITFR